MSRAVLATTRRLDNLDSDDLRCLKDKLLLDAEKGHGSLAAKVLAAAMETLAQSKENLPPDVRERIWAELHSIQRAKEAGRNELTLVN